MSASPEAGAAGYLHPGYAASLAEFGGPRRLPGCDGWVIERFVEASGRRDAMSPYPLFACSDWSRLADDLAAITDLISVAIVTDPFGDFGPGDLERAFPDRLLPFKAHHVADLANPAICKHHRYYARRALAALDAEILEGEAAAEFAEEWTALYANLVARRGLTGIRAFSPEAFEAQMRIPGMVALRARSEGETVSAHLWFVAGEHAYSHLAASSARGYALMAAYALHACALDHFRARGLRFADIGAGAGLGAADDGLSQFKRGWAPGTRPAWFGGRILDRARYDAAVARSGAAATQYFPAYRAGEFG